jgi:hypothetical protein
MKVCTNERRKRNAKEAEIQVMRQRNTGSGADSDHAYDSIDTYGNTGCGSGNSGAAGFRDGDLWGKNLCCRRSAEGPFPPVQDPEESRDQQHDAFCRRCPDGGCQTGGCNGTVQLEMRIEGNR